MFDTIIAIDWSAKATPTPRSPSKDAIWTAVGRRTIRSYYHRTRHELIEWLVGLLETTGRTLVCFDFAFGYPEGLCRAIGCDGWHDMTRRMRDLLEDDETNANNRFEVASFLNKTIGSPSGPFWAHPHKRTYSHLRPKAPEYPFVVGEVSLDKWRVTDHAFSTVHTVWQLAGTGTVGGQSVVGIPRLDELRERVGASVWPFDPIDARVVIAEIYPSMAPGRLENDRILDDAQVRRVVRWLRGLEKQELHALLERPHAHPASAEEGWIIGA